MSDINNEALKLVQERQKAEWASIKERADTIYVLVEELRDETPNDARVLRCREVHAGFQRAMLALEDAANYAAPVEEWEDE